MTKNLLFYFLVALSFSACDPAPKKESANQDVYVKIDGPNLIAPNGEKFFIQGINLGNWLNPEGYMFGFKRTSYSRLRPFEFTQTSRNGFDEIRKARPDQKLVKKAMLQLV